VVVPLGCKPGDSVDFPTDDDTGRTAAIVVPPGAKPGDKLKARVPPSPAKTSGSPAASPAAGAGPGAAAGSTAQSLFDSGRGWDETWGRVASSSGVARPPTPPRPSLADPFAAPLPVAAAAPSSAFGQFDSGRGGSEASFGAALPPAAGASSAGAGFGDWFAPQATQRQATQRLPETTSKSSPARMPAAAAFVVGGPFGGLGYGGSSGGSGSGGGRGGGAQQPWARARSSMHAAAAIQSLGSPGDMARGPQATVPAGPGAGGKDPFGDFGQVSQFGR
jgi:hypothetical protein